MKAKVLMIVIIAAFTVALVGCGGSGGGGKTPEDAVKGMMEAAKAKDWEKAATFCDFEGTAKVMKEAMEEGINKLPEDQQEEAKKMMDEQMKEMTAEKLKEKFIEDKKEETKEDFTYEIGEVKDKTDNSAMVVVKIKQGEKEDEDKIPVVKVNGTWKIGMTKEMMKEMGED